MPKSLINLENRQFFSQSAVNAATTLLKSNELPKTPTLGTNSSDELVDEVRSPVKKAKLASSVAVVAGVLPGIGNYESDSSSDSNSSSDDDEDDLNTSDIIGAKAITKSSS